MITTGRQWQISEESEKIAGSKETIEELVMYNMALDMI